MPPTFYELLGAMPDAPPAEIEDLCERQYNHWRRLVTHHDSKVVNQANQALTLLEKIRETLTDSHKRAAYDSSLGKIGGLSDPSVARTNLPPRLPTPPAPPKQPAATTSTVIVPAPLSLEERVDIWLCPHCKNPNPIGSSFCKKCGQTIGITCPNCRQMVEATAKFCVSCGVNVPLTIQQNELQSALARKQIELSTIEALNPHKGRSELITSLRVATITASSWTALSIIVVTTLLFGWEQLREFPITMGALAFPAIMFAIHFFMVLTLTIVRQRISTSSFLSLVTSFLFYSIPFITQQVAGGLYELNIGTLCMAVSFIFLGAMYCLSLLGLSLNLSRYGCSTALLVLVAFITALLSPTSQIVATIPILIEYRNYASITDYFWLSWPVGIISHLCVGACFTMLALLAWRKTLKVEHDLAVAVEEKRNHLRKIHKEIKIISSDLSQVNQSLVQKN